MLVDDSFICNLIMRKWLELLPFPLAIHDFTDPVQAFSQLASLDPTLIFLDLNMPELDGWQFLQRMQDTAQANRVVILTSSTSAVDKARCADFTNVLLYQTKPVTAAFIEALPPLLQGIQAAASPAVADESGTAYPAHNGGSPIV